MAAYLNFTQTPPFFLCSSLLEPGDGVLADPTENVPPVHGHVVIKQHHITVAHLHPLQVIHHHLFGEYRTSVCVRERVS